MLGAITMKRLPLVWVMILWLVPLADGRRRRTLLPSIIYGIKVMMV